MRNHSLLEIEIEDRTMPKAGLPGPAVVVKPVIWPEGKGLFSDVLLETSGAERKRKTLSTVISISVQCLCMGILILIPLLFTDVLPARELVTSLMMAPPPPPPAPPPPAAVQIKVVKPTTNVIDGRLRAPSIIPKAIAMIKEDSAPVGAGIVGGVEGGVPGGQVGGVIGGIISSTRMPDIPKPAAPPKIIRVSAGVSEGMLVNRVVPEYPPVAKVAHMQGNVELKAVIDTDGSIQQLQLVSGSPLLAPAALQAVAKWRYRPYLLNGVPVAVETNIIVRFSLLGAGG